MTTQRFQRSSIPSLTLAEFLMTGCGRAPSFDVLGSFFPAWLACFTVGLLVSVAVRWLLMRRNVALAVPILAYPSLTALLTFALWLALFR
jgi:fructose-specific phosphotransferase system IIC component